MNIGGYTLTATGWRILQALLAEPLNPANIRRATGLGNAGVTRELPSLDLAEYVEELTTGRFRITDEGRAEAAKPCPVRTPKTRPKPVQKREHKPRGESAFAVTALTPSERTALEQIAAHQGKSIQEIADAVERSAGNFRDVVQALAIRGLVTLEGRSLARIVRLTPEGRERLGRREPAVRRRPAPPPRPVVVQATRPVAVSAILVPPSFAVRGGIKHPTLDSLGFRPAARASQSLVGWA